MPEAIAPAGTVLVAPAASAAPAATPPAAAAVVPAAGATPATPPVAAPAAAAAGAVPAVATPATPPVAAAAPVAPPAAEVVYDLKGADGKPIDAKLAEPLVAFAKEHGLTPVAAQKVLDREAALAKAFDANVQTQIKQVQEKWVAAHASDPELAGKMPVVVAAANRALDRFPEGKALRAELEASGMGNHPVVLKFLAAIGRAAADDTFIAGGSGRGAGPAKSYAEAMFPTAPAAAQG